MTALGRVVRGGVGRRRVQTVVIGLSAAMAVTSAVLGGSLLVASAAPFDTAFAAQHGAHLTARFDGEKVDGGSARRVGDARPASPPRPGRSRSPRPPRARAAGRCHR